MVVAGGNILLRDQTNVVDAVELTSTSGPSASGAIGLRNTGINTVYLTGTGSSWFNAGNVGIGTNSPSTSLDVTSSNTGGTALQVRSNDTGGRQWRIVSTGSTSLGGAGKFQIYDNTSSTDMLTIDAVNGGEVGVGLNSNMSGRLHVKNSIATWSTYNNAVYGEVDGNTQFL